ncbi:cytochrome c oxidase subunit 3 [Azohydromonas lata]|uniref:cytochrome c oxidase subunit 3 n=1 Tax=Azohydromonas lata TaxID=45677 RepID=UPI00082EEEB0|nr:cytochrome c oxidase subunit 3 [Azohydromonas lata]
MSAAAHAEAAAPPPDTGPLGMWIFLATELLFFGGLFAAYAWGRTHWSDGFSEASRHTHVVLGTLNTALLLTSSALVAVATMCAGEERRRRAAARLLAGAALLGVAFLALKGVEYAKEWHEGLFPGPGFSLARHAGAELFFMLYFVMTGLHALHLLIGVGLLGTFALGAWRGSPWADAGHVEVAGLYWHFVDVVWIVLYPLLYLAGRAS